MALRKTDGLDDYLRLLREDVGEAEALFQDILIHVTGFFRDPEAFEALKTAVFAVLLAGKTRETNPLRIWVPGCSTGEEVYSIAISLLEYLGDRASSVPIKIFATDISDQAIETARAGVYLESAVSDVSAERLRRFFVKTSDGYQVDKMLRDMCIFARQDLSKDPPFSNLDLISCRNVLIYFGPVLQKKVLPIFHYSLKPQGFLMLGSSEAVGDSSALFELVERKHKIYSKRPTATSRVFDFPLNDHSTLDALSGEKEAMPVLGKADLGKADLGKEIDRFVLDEYSPPSVVIDDNLKVVQVRGDTGPYLKLAPGAMSADILKLARQGLQFGLRRAIDGAKTTGEAAVEEGLRVRTNDHHTVVNLRVVPFPDGTGGGKCLLVLFEQMGTATLPKSSPGRRFGSWFVSLFRSEGARPATESSAVPEQVSQLRKELDETKRYLQSLVQEQEASNEELRAANEEALSANEELLSTNEELETAKEELQATNEELGTVNDELQSRNSEASRLNDDLSNLLGSTEIPIIMLGNDLGIRRFTPAAAKLLNLIETDVGRPITVLLGGAMAYTFLAAEGTAVGKSKIEPELFEEAHIIYSEAGEKLQLPTDSVVSSQLKEGAVTQTVTGSIPAEQMGLDIGPSTVKHYQSILEEARTVFWNGPMGVFETPPFDVGTRAVARALAEATRRGAISVIGGGDTAAAVDEAGLAESVTHISTGGGASLEFLEGKPFKAIEILDDVS